MVTTRPQQKRAIPGNLAFDATMQDPAFLAEAAAMRAEVEPTTGEEVQTIVAAMYATPRPVVDRVKKLLGK